MQSPVVRRLHTQFLAIRVTVLPAISALGQGVIEITLLYRIPNLDMSTCQLPVKICSFPNPDHLQAYYNYRTSLLLTQRCRVYSGFTNQICAISPDRYMQSGHSFLTLTASIRL